MAEARIRPGKGWYVLAGVVLAAGFAVAAFLIAGVVVDVGSPLTRFSTARPVVVGLEAGDRRTIYVDADAPLAVRSDVRCQVRALVSGRDVRLGRAGNFTMSRGDESYAAISHFTADRDGRHEVRCGLDLADGVALAVGPRFSVVGFVARVDGALAAAFGGVGIAAIVVLVTALNRHTARRRLVGAAPDLRTGTEANRP